MLAELRSLNQSVWAMSRLPVSTLEAYVDILLGFLLISYFILIYRASNRSSTVAPAPSLPTPLALVVQG